ncbi:sigma factor-like helix-turn-helix DNA-binding protein [Streptomyces sp. NPDC088752]|uniref:sigma factor-like helix-turn-helix DNA-binding protein n=1 Tax=Streptomyces sp. NPDC088752 TaxID=3154963 RepID=UPI0034416C88
MVPLTAAQSQRLASLFETHGDRLMRYAYSRLSRTGRSNGEAWALAEDLTQSMWVQAARSGARDLLNEDEQWTEDAERKVLFARVKREMSEHFKLMRSSEAPVDWSDPVTCNTLCPLLSGQCAWAELPDYLARMVAALPQREREALLLKLDGTPHKLMGERLGCSESTADRLAKTAILMLQIDNPELSFDPVALESLPEWEQQALSELSAAQREALLRLDEGPRQTLLLKSQGLSDHAIAKRLGVRRDRVAEASLCAPVLSALTAADMEQAA